MANLILQISIPDSKVQRSKERFLAAVPKTNASLTDKEWFEEVIKRELRRIDQIGERRLLAASETPTEDMFTE